MKLFLFHYILGICSFLLLASFTPTSNSGSLQVHVFGITHPFGMVRLMLYNDPSKFIVKQGYCRSISLPANAAGSVTFDLSDLPCGTYAAALYQDENNNGKLDQNMFQIPLEPYAFSNDIRAKMAIPSFSAAQFTVSSSNAQFSVTLRPWSAQ